jgi:hypothetical protein
VVVHLPGKSVYISALRLQNAADVGSTSYTQRAVKGQPGEVGSRAGISIRKLIAVAGGDPDTFGFLRIQRTNGTFAFLTKKDLAATPDFVEGPPVVSVDGDTTHFFKPLHNPQDLNEVNGADNIATIAGAPLVMSAHTGELFAVRAKATPTTTHATQDVSFSAAVTGSHRNDQLQYSWHFDDGTVGHGQNVTHAYARTGGYDAFVTVAGDDDSGGSSDTIHITVGKPPTGTTGDQSGGGSTDQNAPAGGPVTGGGGGSSTTPSTAIPPPIENNTPQTPPKPLKSIPKTEPGQLTVSGILLASSNPVPIGSLLQSPGSPAAARVGSTPHRELPITGAAVVLLLGLGAFREGARGRIRIPKLPKPWPR